MYQSVQTEKCPRFDFLRCQSDFVHLDVSTTCFRNKHVFEKMSVMHFSSKLSDSKTYVVLKRRQLATASSVLVLAATRTHTDQARCCLLFNHFNNFASDFKVSDLQWVK